MFCNIVKHFRTSKGVINYGIISVDFNNKLLREDNNVTREFNNYYVNIE